LAAMSIVSIFTQVSKIGTISISYVVDSEHISLRAIRYALSKVNVLARAF